MDLPNPMEGILHIQISTQNRNQRPAKEKKSHIHALERKRETLGAIQFSDTKATPTLTPEQSSFQQITPASGAQ